MFGPDEYRYFTAELGKVASALTEARDRLQILRSELVDDGLEHTETMLCAVNAVNALGLIHATLDSATAALPLPKGTR